MIKILHISDFHFCKKYISDFSMRADALCEEVKKYSFDLIVFSGDLVYNGGEPEDFIGARDVLLDKLEAATGIKRSHIVISAGNHDVDRNKVPEMLQDQYKSIESPVILDKWLEKNNNESISLESSKNYSNFIADYYKGEDVIISNYYNVRILETNGIKVGVASLNSSWTSYNSKTDRGQLMLPSNEVSNAINAVKETDVVIVTMHHRLDDFKESFMWDFCEPIYLNTHLLCTGHHHLALESDYRFGGNCVAHSEGNAIYNKFDAASQYGFKIITIDTSESNEPISVKDDEFYFINGSFVMKEGVTRSLANTVARQNEIDFQKSLLRLYHKAELFADDVFVSDKVDPTNGVTFKKLFSNPVIKDISPLEEADEKKHGNYYSVEDILKDENNYLIHGFQGKCGKTSLLWKLYLDSISNFSALGFIPLYINCRNFRNDGHAKANIIKTIRAEFDVNTQIAKQLFENNKLLLLLDDIDSSRNSLLQSIGEELRDIQKYKIVACLGDSLSANTVSNPIDKIPFKKLYFHSIGQKEIHQLTKKWPDLKSSRADIEQKILSVFKQMHIPFNYWTVSLFLWVFDKTDGDKIRNNFELVNLYVDGLLNKRAIVEDRALRIEYRDLYNYLGSLAHKMLEYEEDDYKIPYSIFILFTEDFVKTNKRFPKKYNDVVTALLDARVLKKDSEEKVSIRLKGVFEYFLSFYMTGNDSWRDKIINNADSYLAFANELELYAGFKPDETDFVKKIYERTQDILKVLMDNPEYSDIDAAFQEKVKKLSADVEKIRDAAGHLISKALTLSDLEKEEVLPVAMAQNVPLDSSEVSKKEYTNCYDNTVANFEKSLFLLCRVYRNSNICNEEVGDEILDYILDACCKFSFAIVNTPYDTESPEDELRKLVITLYRFIPIVIQAYFFDAISQFNLDRVFEEKLNSIKQGDVNGKYFKIFLLLFTLLDLDIKNYSYLIDDIQECSPKGAFSYAAFAKVCLLVTKNMNTSQVIRDKLVEVADRLNTNMSSARTLSNERISFKNKLIAKINSEMLKDAQQKRLIDADFNEQKSKM